MTTRRQCVQRSYIKKPLFLWLSNKDNIYVGIKQETYTSGRLQNSPWSPINIFMEHANKSFATKMFFYEQFIRNKMMGQLFTLRGKNLGCYCNPNQLCHVEILIRLISETETEIQTEEEQSPLKIFENNDENNNVGDSDNKFQCYICNFTTKYKYSFNRHFKYVHFKNVEDGDEDASPLKKQKSFFY